MNTHILRGNKWHGRNVPYRDVGGKGWKMKAMILVFGLLVMQLAAGCGSFDFLPIDPDGENIPIYFGEAEGVIFYAQTASYSGIELEYDDTVTGYWTPEQAQVRELEDGIVPFLEASIAPDHYQYGFWEDLDDYKRQYFGLTFGDRDLIYANYFCADDFEHWRTSYVLVMDGGACFFQVLYDPADGTFSDLRINGVA